MNKKCPFALDNKDDPFCCYYLDLCDNIDTCPYKRKTEATNAN